MKMCIRDREQSEKELRQIASEEVYQKVKVVCHDCDGPLAYLGETSFGTPVWVNPLAVGRKVITCLLYTSRCV